MTTIHSLNPKGHSDNDLEGDRHRVPGAGEALRASALLNAEEEAGGGGERAAEKNRGGDGEREEDEGEGGAATQTGGGGKKTVSDSCRGR